MPYEIDETTFYPSSGSTTSGSQGKSTRNADTGASQVGEWDSPRSDGGQGAGPTTTVSFKNPQLEPVFSKGPKKKSWWLLCC